MKPAYPAKPPLRVKLESLKAQHLYRRRQIVEGAQGADLVVDGRAMLSFCSNDYLGLANHPQVVAAFQAAAAHYGVGAGASHLVSGHSAAHHALEEELAAFVGAPRALLFSTGYMANLGVVSALTDRRGTVFEDKLNHASLIDAARLCQARVKRYPHADLGRLESCLAATTGQKLVLTDGVFSMDGDVAPIPGLTALARRDHTRLIVDDAHGLGVVGEHGGGSLELHGQHLEPPVILMGTLGKALGTFGAFVAAEEEVIEMLIQRARTYIYTTALPPAIAEATRVSLALARAETWRRECLEERISQFRRGAGELGLRLTDSNTPIQPILLGEPQAALVASAALREHNILVPAIRPPTVPAHSSRLRVTFSAMHSAAQVDRLLGALADLRVAKS
ncbi:MAG: 8-amino-7-oxononanoate synthase [Acidiferrobacterales bacterium]